MFKKYIEGLTKFFKERTAKNNFPKQLIENIDSLESALGFSFQEKHHFIKALTHRSFLELHPELEKSNERLEFLGDSILNMIVAEYLFENYENEGEGFLTKARSSLVNRERLSQVADAIQLKKYILYNQKYVTDSNEGLNTILADSFEAIIGAIYLDKDLNHAEQFILKWLVFPYEENQDFLIDRNYKGQLLEYTHSKKLDLPRYLVKNIDGPDHKREFTVEAYIGSSLLGIGIGRSKKIAEQNASREALKVLQNANNVESS